MSVVTHVIPQSFAEGQILNIVTPTIPQAQELLVAQTGAPAQVIPMSQVTLATVQVEQKNDPNLERDKQSIYKHPLFPLMALMFERCEQASASTDFPSQESFEQDIRAFIAHQEKEKKSFYSTDQDLDNLMIKAIQVLRIHLLELEKVNELCKDFCTRYTNCLKGKLQSENLLRTESDYDQSMFDEPPKESPTPVQTTSATGGVILQQPFVSTVPAVPTLGPGQIISGGTVYQMVQTPQGLVAQPLQMQPGLSSLTTPVIAGSTPISQIGLNTPQSLVTSPSNNSAINSLGNVSAAFDSDDEDNSKKKNKRGVLPKSATQIMKSWLFQHIVHPYPTEDEKRQIAGQTNLTLLQVNNWFINARRRILQPMLDAGNPDQTKAKKAKPQNKPPQRFWPFSDNKSSVSAGMKSESSNSSTSTPSTPTPITSLSQTIVLPPGAFVTPEGQILNLQGTNMAAMLNQVKQSPSPQGMDKDLSDNNNNSHNTDNEPSDSEDLT